MTSLAGQEIPLEREPSAVRSAAARHVAGALVVAASCFAVAGLGSGRSEAAPVAATDEAPQTSASETRPVAPAATAPADDPTAEAPLPDNASAELRSLARQAIAGRAFAEHDLGTFFALGIEVPRNLERAAYWYRRAADRGVANAAYNLGVLLERGLGVPRDPEAAVARFRKAAEAGHTGALNALGLAYLKGSGVARDPQEALHWFRSASVGGNPRGAYNLGRLYESGELGPPDPRLAAAWYRIAAEAGYDQAGEALARLQAAPGTAPWTVARTGFVSLAEADLLTPVWTTTAAAGPDRILDDLAAQMAAAGPAGLAETAMASAPVPLALPRAVVLEPPFTTPEIEEIQRLLARLNFDPGPADGRIGPRTRAAIAAFQRSLDLPVTRRPSAALLEALHTAAQAVPAEAAVTSAPMPEPRLTAARIKEIQRQLRRLGFNPGPIDGLIGPRTRAAIAAFERSHDLPVTRRASAALLETLRTTPWPPAWV
ncbi:SEL1-like repeat protein [Inquilinus limosus]|uniref:peptidoglycan-binding protein n=1 Tax=Inquilinus limosus TaxID=171674 RepID=UPI003F16A03E